MLKTWEEYLQGSQNISQQTSPCDKTVVNFCRVGSYGVLQRTKDELHIALRTDCWLPPTFLYNYYQIAVRTRCLLHLRTICQRADTKWHVKVKAKKKRKKKVKTRSFT